MIPSIVKPFIRSCLLNKRPILLTGMPGCAKTSLVNEVVTELGWGMITVHPVVDDPTDYKGMPFVTNSHAEFMPFDYQIEMIDTDKPLVFFGDDLLQALDAVQGAMMRLLLAKKIGTRTVSPHVRFISASNRKSDKSGGGRILEALKSRHHSIVPVNFSLDDFRKWWIATKRPASMISYMHVQPQEFDFERMWDNRKPEGEITNHPLPRTVANLGDLQMDNLPTACEYEAYSGAVGQAWATKYLAYLKVYRELPDPDSIIASPDKAVVSSDAAVQYAICNAVAYRATVDNIGSIIAYANRLPSEFNIMLVRDSLDYCKDIITKQAKPFLAWASKHSEVLL